MIEILTRDACAACGGSGRAMHEDWPCFERWAASFNCVKGHAPNADSIALWWLEHGYSYTPDGTVPCQVCDGTGKASAWITFDELLARMEMRRPS